MYKKLDEVTFINYFQKHWLSLKRMGWYDHYCDLVPIQNNALESINRYVKEDGTLRKRMGIKEFLIEQEEGFVKTWSKDRNPIVDGEEIVEEQLSLSL